LHTALYLLGGIDYDKHLKFEHRLQMGLQVHVKCKPKSGNTGADVGMLSRFTCQHAECKHCSKTNYVETFQTP